MGGCLLFVWFILLMAAFGQAVHKPKLNRRCQYILCTVVLLTLTAASCSKKAEESTVTHI